MRLYCLLALFSTAVSLAGIARADSFTFRSTVGDVVSFTLDASQPTSITTTIGFGFSPVTVTGTGGSSDGGAVQFFNADYGWLGGFDIYINSGTGLSSYFNGPKLYTGDPSNASFIQGSYKLLAGTFYGGSMTGTLVIGPDVPVAGAMSDSVALGGVATTPEPSTLILLGSASVGAIGMARRRFTRPVV